MNPAYRRAFVSVGPLGSLQARMVFEPVLRFIAKWLLEPIAVEGIQIWKELEDRLRVYSAKVHNGHCD